MEEVQLGGNNHPKQQGILPPLLQSSSPFLQFTLYSRKRENSAKVVSFSAFSPQFPSSSLLVSFLFLIVFLNQNPFFFSRNFSVISTKLVANKLNQLHVETSGSFTFFFASFFLFFRGFMLIHDVLIKIASDDCVL